MISEPLCLLHITDCHLVASGGRLLNCDTQASLEQVLSHAIAQNTPDLVVASGDLAHDPQVDIYQRFVTTVRHYTSAPLLCLPGNHDVLGLMQQAQMPMQPLRLGQWSIVALDSHVDDQPQAQVSAADRDLVAQHFAQSDADHLLLATHHPLIEVDCPWLDQDRIQNPDELLEWLADRSVRLGSPRLRGAVFGHAHQSLQAQMATPADLPVFGTPSTCFQFQPRSETFCVDDAPPGYRWLWLDADGGITTRVERAG